MLHQETGTDWAKIVRDGVRAAVADLSDKESFDLAERYGTHNYHPLPVNIVRAEGIRAYDGSGVEYIDCIGSYSAVAHGHLNPFVARTIAEQLRRARAA